MPPVNEFKTIVYTSMVTGFISCICSGLLLFCIFFLSELKWRSPLRRIIIGFCIHDMLVSFGSGVSGFALPKGKGLLASGNQLTCDIQGYLIQSGAVGSLFYNAALAVYYVSLIAFSMKKKDFKRKIEWWIHLVINAFSFGTATFLLFGKYFNSYRYGNMCHISASPLKCLVDKNVDCERGSEKAVLYVMIFLIYPVFVSFTIVFISMVIMIRIVVLNKIRSDRWRMTDSLNVNRNFLLRCVFAICELTSYSMIRKRLQSHSANNQNKTIPTKRQFLTVPSGGDTSESQGSEINSTGGGVSVFSSNLSKNSPKTSLGTSMASSGTFVEETNLYDRVKSNTPGLSLDHSLAGSIPGETENVRPSAVSRSGTADDPYAFNIRKVMAKIQKETSSSVNSKNIKRGKAIDIPASLSKTETVIIDHNRLSSFDKYTNHDPKCMTAINDAPTSKETKNSVSIEEEFVVQALLYMASFLFSYTFAACSTIVEVRKVKISFAVREINRLTLPLQGLFFMLVYLRPLVNKIRKDDPTISYFKAYIIAAKKGGDNDRSDSTVSVSDDRRNELQQCVYENYRRRRSFLNEKSLMMDAQCVKESFEKIKDEEISSEIDEMDIERD